MLVSKRQEWELDQQQPQVSHPHYHSKSHLDAPLRKKCLGVVILLAFMAVAITIQSEWIVRSGYQLVQMKKQVAALEKENDTLHLEIVKLKSPERIERIATKTLGMVQPAAVYFGGVPTKSTSPFESGEKATGKQAQH